MTSTDLPTLEAALKLADQDSPLPSLAGPALKVLRAALESASHHVPPGFVMIPLSDYLSGGSDSATLTLAAKLRELREAMDNHIHTSSAPVAAWVGTLDALLYSLAEERTKPIFSGGSILPKLWSMAGIGDVLAKMSSAKNGDWVTVACDEAGDPSITVIPGSELYTCTWCEVCNPSFVGIFMVVCPTCGNKRCPHAHDHRNACTGSNAVGQPGSSWEHVKPITPAPDKDC